MKKAEIEKQESVKRWLDGVYSYGTGSTVTKSNYLRWFTRFIKWVGKTPDQLIEERKEQLKNEDETVKRKAEEQLRNFCIWLEREQGLSRNSSILYHDAIRSFYRYNYVPLQLRTPKKRAVRGTSPHTHEEIIRLYDVSNTRDRAIILCLAESGISRADFVKLTYGHVKEDYEKDSNIIHLNLIREKEQVNYETFFGINATKALRTYIEMRKRKGETMKEDTPLFSSTKSGGFFNPMGLNCILERLAKKSGIKTSPHRLRKFFESNLATKVPSLLVKYWMGHSLGVESHYFKPSLEEQRKAYLDAYSKIDILETTRKPSEEPIRTGLAIVLGQMVGKSQEEQWRLLKNFFEMMPQPTKEVVVHVMEEPEIQGRIETLLNTPMKEVLKIIEKETEPNKNEEDCQRIVPEENLEEWLTKGWKVVTTLPSGKIIITNE